MHIQLSFTTVIPLAKTSYDNEHTWIRWLLEMKHAL